MKLKRIVFFPKYAPLTIGWYSGGVLISIPWLLMFSSGDNALLVMLTKERYFFFGLALGEIEIQIRTWSKKIKLFDWMFGTRKWMKEPTGEPFTIRNSQGEWVLRPGIGYYKRRGFPKKEGVVKGHILLHAPIDLPDHLDFVKREIPIEAADTFGQFPQMAKKMNEDMEDMSSIILEIPKLVARKSGDSNG